MSEPVRSPETAALFAVDVEAFAVTGAGDEAWLEPDERSIVADAVPNRRQEFAAGRACARAALGALGLEPVAIPRSERRSPVWPAGVIGSITHTAASAASAHAGPAHVAAAVGRLSRSDPPDKDDAPTVSIGLDIERVGRVSDAVAGAVFSDTERAWINDRTPELAVRMATVVFSAKEAFYKAQWPITNGWVGFLDVDVSLVDRRLVFTPIPTTDEVAAVFERLRWEPDVRYRDEGPCVVTGVTVWAA